MIFLRFMNSSFGRLSRMFLGTLIVWYGAKMGGALGNIMAILGIVPFFAGLFNLCLLAPLFGYPVSGKKMKAVLREQKR